MFYTFFKFLFYAICIFIQLYEMILQLFYRKYLYHLYICSDKG